MPRSLIDTNVLSGTAQIAACLLEYSDIIRFKPSIATVLSSSLHLIETNLLITLLCKVATNTSDRYNLRIRDCGTLLVLVCLEVLKFTRNKSR